MSDNFDQNSINALNTAEDYAVYYNDSYVSSECLLLGLIENCDNKIRSVLDSLEISKSDILNRLKKTLKNSNSPTYSNKKDIVYGTSVGKALKKVTSQNSTIRAYNIFKTLITIDEKASSYITSVDSNNYLVPKILSSFDKEDSPIKSPIKRINTTSNKNIINVKHLLKYNKISPKFVRYIDYDNLFISLNKKHNNNVLLVGDSGVGKKEIAYELMRKIYDKECPKSFYNKKLFMLNIIDIISDTKYRGELESKISDLLDKLKLLKNSIFLVVDISVIFRYSGGTSIESYFFEIFDLENLNFICTCDYEFYKKNVERSSYMRNTFKIVNIDSSSKDETLSIIKNSIKTYEKFHKVKYNEDIFDDIYEISGRYIPNEPQPSCSINLLDESGCYSRIKNKKVVDKDDIRYIISKKTNITMENINSFPDLEHVRSKINGKYVSQQNALDKVISYLYKIKVGLQNPNKPLVSFLFLGPTGVGKTYLCELISEYFFKENSFLRIDMSEYMEKSSITKFIGSSPGYVGYKDSSVLVDFVTKNPYSLILFDEIEKADKNIIDVFLQILDKGDLTISDGRKVNFKNNIVVFTSNLGYDLFNKEKIGFAKNGNMLPSFEELDNMLCNHFKPELINRIDDVVIFDHFTDNDVSNLLDIMLNDFSERVGSQYNIEIELSDKVKKYIIENGYSKKYGARFLYRFFNKNIENRASSMIVDNKNVKKLEFNLSDDCDILVKSE